MIKIIISIILIIIIILSIFILIIPKKLDYNKIVIKNGVGSNITIEYYKNNELINVEEELNYEKRQTNT